MHELSVASQIWQSVTKAARAHGGGRVLSITLELGELNLIEDEQLTFWIKELSARDGSPDVQLKITRPKGRVRCNDCSEEGEADLPTDDRYQLLPPIVSCPACGSRSVSITGGRELRVVSAEIETAPGS